MNSRSLAVSFAAACLLAPASARGHAGAFILAKCGTEPGGTVSLELTVDCGQHPTLTEKTEAIAALRGVLVVQSPTGPLALDSLAAAVPEFSTVPDPGLPFPADPLEAGRSHDLVKLRYTWQPGVPEVSFAVPAGNPHDVLFWLDGSARPAAGPVSWRILIAGDVSPPIPVPVPSADVMPGKAVRLSLAVALGLALAGFVWWRRVCCHRQPAANT